MSFDLFFYCRSDGDTVSREDFVDYFGSRRNYKISETQAWYENEDTGVYFSFDYSESEQAENESDQHRLIPVAFNLNFFRPHAFGLEAEPEVTAFVKSFDLLVSDPQMDGMGDGEYAPGGFLKGWNAGNQFGYRALAAQQADAKVLTLPTSEIEASWTWNFRREARQDKVGEEAFVPRIMFLDDAGAVRTAVAWGDGIPILLPTVDCLIIPRQRLSAPAVRADKIEEIDDIVVVGWREMEKLIVKYPCLGGSPPCYKLFYDDTPSEIATFIRQRKPPEKMVTGVAFDQVLNREMIEEARNAAMH